MFKLPLHARYLVKILVSRFAAWCYLNVKSVFKLEIVQKQVTTNLDSVLCSGWKWYEEQLLDFSRICTWISLSGFKNYFLLSKDFKSLYIKGTKEFFNFLSPIFFPSNSSVF